MIYLRRAIPICLSSLLALSAAKASSLRALGSKVEVCHIPPDDPGNFHTIKVSEQAVNAHLAHGDMLGFCNDLCDHVCSDGNACTIDHDPNLDCETGGCTRPDDSTVDCNDSNPCTIDSCDPVTGCSYQDVICGAGETCNASSGACERICPTPGIALNKQEADIADEGWVQCYSGEYNVDQGAEFAENVKRDCGVGDYVMYGCRPIGDTVWQLVGYGHSDAAFTDTGKTTDVVTPDGDGIEWYYNGDYSMGFAPGGELVNKGGCDNYAWGAGNRLCWHTYNGFSKGW